MSITDKLYRLGDAAKRLNDGSDHLNQLIAKIDKVLGNLMIGMDYVHPRPLGENVTIDEQGKRVILLNYLCYLKVQRTFHLAVKTVKILESKLALATEEPGTIVPLLQAPRLVRHQAIDLLPELVSGLAAQVDDIVGAMERRCASAEALLDHLEGIAGEPPHSAGGDLRVVEEPPRGRKATLEFPEN